MSQNKVTETEIPSYSILQSYEATWDYKDSYKINLFCAGEFTINLAGKAISNFAAQGPIWVKNLIGIRNMIASVLGLKKTDSLEDRFNDRTFEIGGKILGFTILEKTSQEIIFGKNDKHLDFKSSLCISTKENNLNTIHLSTVVKYNNWVGKLYFLPVMPIHQILMKMILKNLICS